jgi:glutamate synthase domain-containing protein 2
MSARLWFLFISALLIAFLYAWAQIWPGALAGYAVVLPLVALGFADMFQKKKAVLRNFPVIGHLRYLLEAIRPELQQYFVESNLDGRPINRETRSVVYQRAKGELQTLPFGTQRNVYEVGYEWVGHSMYPIHVDPQNLRVTVGNATCLKPYSASIFNISAMSFGSLSKNAILALNAGAKKGGFYHNTGEGGMSDYHLGPGGDIVWQIGTGYFGCRDDHGNFNPERFAEKAKFPNVKMIELKLSQGAKPAHGGILPKAKITPEIARIRGVGMDKDINSPPGHSAFQNPTEMMTFIVKLRELSGGKPVGIKLCVGREEEFQTLCLAMKQTGIVPDFITVDGGEGGTGAAPLEFSNHVGMPLRDGLRLVHRVLKQHGLREQTRIIVSGKIFTAFNMVTVMALGADIVNCARGMMLALGCIQALRCNTNQCPTGVATNDPYLMGGLDPVDKAERVYRYHREAIKAFAEILGAMGLTHPSGIGPQHIYHRISGTEVKTYDQIFGV